MLGFFNIVLATLTVGAVAATGVLARKQSLNYLVPYTLAAAFGFFVLLVIGIFIVMLRDPTKLQLGTVSSSDYLNYQIIQGDSAAGERLELIRALQQQPKQQTTSPQVLPPGDEPRV